MVDVRTRGSCNSAALLSDRIRHARRLGGFTQAQLAREVGVGPSAVAQWELPNGTSPTVDNLVKVAVCSNVSFEWLSTGRGPATHSPQETPAFEIHGFALDHTEERLLLAFRRLAPRKREPFVQWMEEIF